MNKVCIECQVEKPLSKFFANGFYKGKKKYKPRCGDCDLKLKSARLRRLIAEHFVTMACTRCGYDKSTVALECHHRVPNEKSHLVSKMGSFSEAKIKAELEKCELVCSNCHREIHGDAE